MKFEKSVSLVLGALISLGAVPVKADDLTVSAPMERPSRPNMLLINPGDLFNGIVSVEYERAVATWFGVTFGLSVLSFRGVFSRPEQNSYIAVMPELGARFHFIQDAPGGLWIGPYIGAGYVAGRSSGSVTRAFAYGVGAALGYNFIIGRHFVFQLGVGSGFNDFGDGLAFAPRIRLGLGAAF